MLSFYTHNLSALFMFAVAPDDMSQSRLSGLLYIQDPIDRVSSLPSGVLSIYTGFIPSLRNFYGGSTKEWSWF